MNLSFSKDAFSLSTLPLLLLTSLFVTFDDRERFSYQNLGGGGETQTHFISNYSLNALAFLPLLYPGSVFVDFVLAAILKKAATEKNNSPYCRN